MDDDRNRTQDDEAIGDMNDEELMGRGEDADDEDFEDTDELADDVDDEDVE